MQKIFFVIIVCTSIISSSCSQKSGASSTDASQEYPALDHGVVLIEDYKYIDKDQYSNYGVATLAGGCFWCTEAAFERIDGVIDVISGYIGGEEKYPSYQAVSAKMTSHAEAIQVYYDKEKISYDELLEVFFVAHDPTQLNRQGPDVGPQYRSSIFYHDEEEKAAATNHIQKLDASGKFASDIVTTLEPYTEFWVAEGYHQNFYELNPNQGYVNNVSRPKVEKVMKVFKEKLKPQFQNK